MPEFTFNRPALRKTESEAIELGLIQKTQTFGPTENTILESCLSNFKGWTVCLVKRSDGDEVWAGSK